MKHEYATLERGREKGLDWENSETFLMVCDFQLLLQLSWGGKSQNKTKYFEVERNNLTSLPGKKGVEDSPSSNPMKKGYPRHPVPAFF